MTKPGAAVGKSEQRNQPSENYSEFVQPFLKWAGGKRQLLPTLHEYMPAHYDTYHEPFLGAAAVLFELQPRTAVINDANEELINCYQVIKEQPEELIADACAHPINKEYFYSLRSKDRDPDFRALSAVERASRIIFLNKTCYNGLFRVNSRGHFNVPFGKYIDPTVVDSQVIRAVSRYLNDADVEILNNDFASALSRAAEGDFVYLDPPYDPLSDTSSFTGYNLHSFGREEQRRLKAVCDALDMRGCNVLLSNSDTSFIRGLYSDEDRYTIVEVSANRSINSVGGGRGKINELLIFNNYKISTTQQRDIVRESI